MHNHRHAGEHQPALDGLEDVEWEWHLSPGAARGTKCASIAKEAGHTQDNPMILRAGPLRW
jgi:hypothetical protein